MSWVYPNYTEVCLFTSLAIFVKEQIRAEDFIIVALSVDWELTVVLTR